jgi:hypothetical protein
VPPLTKAAYPQAFRPTGQDARAYGRMVTSGLISLTKQGHVAQIWIAAGFVVEGDREKTFEWLQKAVENEDSEMLYNIRLPLFDPIHSDPRYKELMQRIGLPP